MDRLLNALSNPMGLAVVEYLLGLDNGAVGSPRQATHAAIRESLGMQGGTLTKILGKLEEAHLVVTSPGRRADQPLYGVRQSQLLLALLRCCADLDAAVAEEFALLYSTEAALKSDRAKRLARKRIKPPDQ